MGGRASKLVVEEGWSQSAAARQVKAESAAKCEPLGR